MFFVMLHVAILSLRLRVPDTQHVADQDFILNVSAETSNWRDQGGGD